MSYTLLESGTAYDTQQQAETAAQAEADQTARRVRIYPLGDPGGADYITVYPEENQR